MNYNEANTKKKKKRLVSHASKNKRKLTVSLFKLFLAGALFCIVVGMGIGFGAMKGILDDVPEVSAEDLVPQGYQTTIYNQNGKKVDTLNSYDSYRIYATIDAISDNMKNAIIAIEDERFYQHNGIDIRGIGGVAVNVLSGGKARGASTLTQQLIKNQVFNVGMNEKNRMETVERKIQEQYLAVELEKTMTKEQILEYYLNTINLGQGAYGVQAAANRYFNKDVSKLTISECAVLAAIPQAPTKYDPVENPEFNSTRRKDVLAKELELGFISEDEYNNALSDDVYSRIKSVHELTMANKSVNSYYIDAVIRDVKKKLVEEKGMTDAQASNTLYSGGLSIYMCQDDDVQKICDEIANDDSNYPQTASVGLEYVLSIEVPDKESETGTKDINVDTYNLLRYFRKKTENSKYNNIYSSEETAKAAADEYKKYLLGEYPGSKVLAEKLRTTMQPQISVTVMDQHTGQVLALVGGRGKKEGDLALNRATMSTRQPGSTFKVLAAFVPGMDSAGMSLATSYKDEPYKFKNGIEVRNWYGGYRGWASIHEAIENSMNIIAVKTITDVDPAVSIEYLKKMGFTTLVDGFTNANGDFVSDVNQSLALGGLTKGVTNIEITGAYASIANEGNYVEPILYTKVLDHDGNILIDNTPETHRAIKETTAWLATHAMEDVIKSGTGKPAQLKSKMPVAGKTGTTSSNYDYWFCGYSPYLTCSVWMGYDSNTDFSNKPSYHKKIWAKIMDAIIELKEQSTDVDFRKPEGIVQVTVCADSGLKPIAGVCPTATDYADKDNIPEKTCDVHKKVNICLDSKLPANKFCPHTKSISYSINEEEKTVRLEGVKDIEGMQETVSIGWLSQKCTMHTENSEYVITTYAGAGGTISNSQTVALGQSVTIVIEPDPGYKIAVLTVDGQEVKAKKKVTFKDVSSDHSVSVTFKETKKATQDNDDDDDDPIEPTPEPQTEAPTEAPAPEPQPEPEPQPQPETPSEESPFVSFLKNMFWMITMQ